MEIQLNRTEAAFVAWAENVLERLQDAMAENEGLREALEAVERWATTDIFSEEGTIGYFAETVMPIVDNALSRTKGEV